MEGNAYLTHHGADGERDGPGRRGGMRWSSKESVISVFFRTNRAAELDLSLKLRVPEGSSEITVSSGEVSATRRIAAGDEQVVEFGKLTTAQEGHVRVDLKGISRTGPVFAEVSSIQIASNQAGLELTYVREGGDNRFYWGRRGPSVHLGYRMPRGKPIEWAYSELTVPVGEDPIGSYFMANGFGEGYFGIQVNSPTERRVLFSVWSPYQTDRPSEIPEDQRIVVLKRGEGVRTGEFGNEGSGGQSFLVYPWQAGKTYRFLTRVHPDGNGQTIYTAWFHPPDEPKWRLIASFKRPKTDKHLTGFHSFLENFNPSFGHVSRRGWHGNQWVRDTDGQWHEITEARFTGDDIANRKYRLDFAGGSDGTRFFLRNGGFFDENVAIGSSLKREPSPAGPPEIDFDALD